MARTGSETVGAAFLVCLTLVAFVAVGCGEPAGTAGTGGTPVVATDPLPPGWGVEFGWAGGSAGPQSLKSFSPTAAFALFPAQAPHPLVSPAGFTATYSARVTGDAPGRYRFGVEGTGGRASVSVYGDAAAKLAEATASGEAPVFTPWVELRGPTPGATLSVKFTRAGDGPARLRTWWEREGAGAAGFMAEPIPPGAARVPSFAVAGAAAGLVEQRGRVLIGTLGCVHCHAPPPAPVLGADGHGTHSSNPAIPHSLAPVLGEVGDRASAAWLARWIADPQKLSPGSPMPDVFTGDAGDGADVEALVHFLVSIAPARGRPAADAAPDAEPAARGRRLYHTVGCAVCHGATDSPASALGDPSLSAEVPGEPAPAPFPDLAGKWRTEPLRAFLLNPSKARPQGRMPGMALTPAEAGDVAAYLIDRFGTGAPAPFAVDAAKAARGRIVYTSRGCASCHTLGPTWTGGDPLREIVSTLRPRGIASMRGAAGCLDPKDARSPRYTISDADRAAIEAGLAAVRRTAAGAASSPIDAGRMAIESLGCRRCHETEGAGGPSEEFRPYFRDHAGVELGDEGRFPPRLTGVGWKLRTPWMRDVLTQAGRARPYMTTRMPQFGDPRAMDLAETFASTEGIFATTDEPDPEATEVRVQAGRRLVGDTGLNCITCHVVGDLPPVGTPGPDLRRAAARNRYEWWRRYVQNPPRFKIGTRMPSFFATGKGTVTEVYGGDPVRQSEAIWAYLSLRDRMPPPSGAVVPGGAVRVADRPVVMRAHPPDAGIAVGYPAGLHFTFDSESCRLVGAWRGDFLGARGSRSGTVWRAPDGPSILIGDRPGAPPTAAGEGAPPRFGGYRLDEGGVPTFTYTVGGVEVQERFEPLEEGRAFRRSFRVSGPGRGASVWLNTGPRVRTARAVSGVTGEHEATIGDDSWRGFGSSGDGPVVFEVEFEP